MQSERHFKNKLEMSKAQQVEIAVQRAKSLKNDECSVKFSTNSINGSSKNCFPIIIAAPPMELKHTQRLNCA